jgi:hypothetical protein
MLKSSTQHTAHGTKRTRKKYNFSFLITVLFSHSQCLNDPLLYPFCLHPMSDFQSGGQAAADPANRAWLGRRLQLGERRRPKVLPCAAARLSGTSRRRPSPTRRRIRRPRGHSVRCRAAVRRAVTRKIATPPSPAFVTLSLVTTVSPHPPILYSPSAASDPFCKPRYSTPAFGEWI